MSDERTIGLILRTRPLTETSLIVHWLTPDLGRIATVAKGARRPKSPFRGKLDLFYGADFSFARSRRSDLHTLREVSLRDTHPALRHNLAALRQASCGAGLLELTTETETPLPAIYGLTAAFLEAVSKNPPRPQYVFAFEFKLFKELGLKPDLTKSRLRTGTRKIVELLGEGDWRTISNLKLSPAQTSELREFLNGFLIFHFGKMPKNQNTACKD